MGLFKIEIEKDVFQRLEVFLKANQRFVDRDLMDMGIQNLVIPLDDDFDDRVVLVLK